MRAEGESRSPDFESATNRVDIRAELPFGSLRLTGPTSDQSPSLSFGVTGEAIGGRPNHRLDVADFAGRG